MTERIDVDDAKGFAWVDAPSLHHYAEMKAAAHTLLNAPGRTDGKKGYLRPVLSETDLGDHAAFVAFALDERVLEAAERYLGEPPRLRSVQLFRTPVNDTTAGSQKAHFDHIGARQLKLFVYLCDVDMQNGPFCFIPADASASFKHRPTGKGGRFEDEDLSEAGDVLLLKGPAGTAAMVDTTRCLHFGGRARTGERVMLMVQYVRAADDTDVEGVCRPAAPRGLDLSPRQQAALRA